MMTINGLEFKLDVERLRELSMVSLEKKKVHACKLELFKCVNSYWKEQRENLLFFATEGRARGSVSKL